MLYRKLDLAQRGINLAIISDGHNGHCYSGFTPRGFDYRPSQNATRKYKAFLARRIVYAWVQNELQRRNIDVFFYNGDAIDGRGEKSGALELIDSDRDSQARGAATAINTVKCQYKFMTYGTPYHSGNVEKWENIVARLTGAEIASEIVLNLNGVLFHIKHKIGSSSIPHGRATAIMQKRLWSERMAASRILPPIHVHVRSHVHYAVQVYQPGWMGVVTPAMQIESAYGAEQCDGETHLGFALFNNIKSSKWIDKPDWEFVTFKKKELLLTKSVSELETWLKEMTD